MKFWNWGPKTIWHNMEIVKKITPPYSAQCVYAKKEFDLDLIVQLCINWQGMKEQKAKTSHFLN